MPWPLEPVDRRKVYFVRRIANTITVIAQKKVLSSARDVSYKKHTYDLSIANPALRIKNIFYYLVDIDSGQLNINDPKRGIDPKLLGSIKGGLVKQLTSGLEATPLFTNIIMMLLFAGIGLAVGYIIGNFFPIR